MEEMYLATDKTPLFLDKKLVFSTIAYAIAKPKRTALAKPSTERNEKKVW